MAYQLNFSLTPAEAVRQVAQEQLQKAVEQLGTRPEGLHEAVHNVRKRLKKVRALIRLVRPVLGEKHYQLLNGIFRDVGRKLAPLRDALVRQQVVDLLQEAYRDQLKVTVFQGMQQQLTEDLQVLEGVAQEEELLKQVQVQLEEQLQQLSQWPLEKLSWKSLLKGHLKSYRRAYRAMPAAYKQESLESFHEWRKRIKYCWYHYRLLKELWQPVMKVMAKETHVLASLLGDAHDRSEFVKYKVVGKPNELLQWAAEHERDTLRTKAKPIGKKLLSLPPEQHDKQLMVFLKVLQKEQDW